MFYFWLGEEAQTMSDRIEASNDAFYSPIERAMLLEACPDVVPYCDGDFTDEEIIEADGFITCYMSGPIRPIPRD